jgi:hypothetical protein
MAANIHWTIKVRSALEVRIATHCDSAVSWSAKSGLGAPDAISAGTRAKAANATTMCLDFTTDLEAMTHLVSDKSWPDYQLPMYAMIAMPAGDYSKLLRPPPPAIRRMR